MVRKKAANIKRLEKFREKAASRRMVAFWENKDQLHGEILSSLHKIMATTPEAVGWMRASVVPQEEEEKDVQLSLAVAEFKAISGAKQRINYFDKLPYKLQNECFSEAEFLEEFIKLIDLGQSKDIISRAIQLIPYHLSYKASRYLIEKTNIDSIFQAQCTDGKLRDSEFSKSIIQLLLNLSKYSTDYATPIFNALKAGDISAQLKDNAICYIGYSYCHSRGEATWRELLNYIKGELDNPNRVLTIHDLTSLLALSCDDENAFVELYNVFLTSDRAVQQEIVNGMFEWCGSDLYIVTPRIQRMFFALCDKVYSWNDDEITATLLSYCLFTRTYDIYTVEEVFDKLDDFNDDVFYLFFWQLGFGEFGRGTEETYNLDDEEKARVTQIIKDRKHPRWKKLLEHIR